ncbi:MAG: Glutamyl-tRNA(Gln) amidotransferase subunit A, partial [uncultured bacterium]
MLPLHHLSAIQIRDAFLKGDISAVQIVHHFLSRIESYDDALGAFLSVLNARVLLKAEALDKKR